MKKRQKDKDIFFPKNTIFVINCKTTKMEKGKKRLIRQLEKLETQIDALKSNYLSRASTLPTQPQTKEIPVTEITNTQRETGSEENQKLLAFALRTGAENSLYKAVNKKLQALMKSGKETFTKEDLKVLQQTLDQAKGKTDNWEIFKQKFTSVYPGFFDNLQKAHPELTKTEVKFCTYLRIHLTSHQIASVMDISMEAIRKNRYRIRKKLKLNTEDSLEAYIDRF